MQKKILIAASALFLLAIALIVIFTSNPLAPDESSFVGKIQNDVTLAVVNVTDNIVNETTNNSVSTLDEVVNLDTKPVTVATPKTEIIEVENITSPPLATENTETKVNAVSANSSPKPVQKVPDLQENSKAKELKTVPDVKKDKVLEQASNSTNTANLSADKTEITNLAATKPPLESLLFKSGEDKLSVPNITSNPSDLTDTVDLSKNKLDNGTVKTDESKKTEAPKLNESSLASPKVEAPKAEVPKLDPPKIETPKVEAPIVEAQLDTLAGATESGNAKVLVTSTKLKANGQKATITAAKLEMTGDAVSLRLDGNQALSAKTYILQNPERVVFDLSGKWELSVPRVISNRMVKGIRLGEQKTGTRIVFDMLVPAKKSEVKKIDANSLELIIR